MPSDATVNYGFPITLADGSEYIGPDDIRLPVIAIDTQLKSTNNAILNKLQTQASLVGKRIHAQTFVGTTDINGFLTVAHTAGVVPVYVFIQRANTSSTPVSSWGTDTYTLTTFRARFHNYATGSAFDSSAVGQFVALIIG